MLIEIYGESGVGKTQFCMQQMVEHFVKDSGSRIVLIDTQGRYRAKRLQEIYESNLEAKEGFRSFDQQIMVWEIRSSQELVNLLFKLLAMNVLNIGLIVIDSLSCAFRSERYMDQDTMNSLYENAL